MTTGDLIAKIEARYSLPSAYGLCMRFMLASLVTIEPIFSPTARRAFDVAGMYWAGQATENELEAARVECWQSLDSIGATTNLVEPVHCATRAVICVTYSSPPSEDIVEILEWFASVVHLAGCPESQVEKLLQSTFEI